MSIISMNMSINDNAKKTNFLEFGSELLGAWQRVNFFGAWQRVDTETSPHATKINL